MKVIIYTTPACPFCKMTKEFLEENEIEYKDVDVSLDEDAAKEMVDKSGRFSVPQIDIDGTVMIGFDKESLEERLCLKKDV
ncbi:MAG: glutaredoxin family protein [Halobacteriota archaeon]|nr:glutaredoxin family protein [Halobacteriota archaeon]